MKLSFHGAARSVTGSRHMVETPACRLLLDCGLFQGRREEALRQNCDLGFDPKCRARSSSSMVKKSRPSRWPLPFRQNIPILRSPFLMLDRAMRSSRILKKSTSRVLATLPGAVKREV